jgi:zinc transporter, ZIP family
MIDWFRELAPPLQALLAGTFTWGVTAAGAGLVFLTRSASRKLLDSMLGFAAGVMIAASVFSLLIPAIELAEDRGDRGWLVAAIGFVAGGCFLALADALIPHLHLGQPRSEAEGLSTTWQRTTLLVLAITLHNIPEGMAIGVAFGAAQEATIDGTLALAGAIALTLGIGMQNFPEGAAVSLPLRSEGLSRRKSFMIGQGTGAVEPFAAALGALAVVMVAPLLPYALAFAAGAMIYVVVEELIPGAREGGHGDLATMATMLGFTLMMVLDVALG